MDMGNLQGEPTVLGVVIRPSPCPQGIVYRAKANLLWHDFCLSLSAPNNARLVIPNTSVQLTPPLTKPLPTLLSRMKSKLKSFG